MYHDYKTVGGPIGMEFPEPVVRRFTRRGAAMAVGELAAVDHDLSDAATTTHKMGDTAGSEANVVVLDAAHLTDGATILVMATEAAADDTESEFMLIGVSVPISVEDSNAGDDNCLVTDLLLAKAAQARIEVDQAATPVRIVGRPQITATTEVENGAAAVKIPVFFNGVDFLGTT